MKKLQHFWRQLAPDELQGYIRFILEPKSYKERRVKVLSHFNKIDPDTFDPYIIEGLKYLKTNKYSPFPYLWTKKYDNLFVEVNMDKENDCFYVLFDGKRMYFPSHYTEKQVIWTVRSLYKEQDPQSPHLYLTNDFQVEPNSIVIDAGVAEGNFALSVVEKAKKLYLIECDAAWMRALKLTFSPWKDKVIFIEKFLSDIESESSISIDALFKPAFRNAYFIKMDIEGYEQKALAGMKSLVASGNSVKMDVCTYHHPNDLTEIESIIKEYGFDWEVTPSYMLYFLPGEEPSFRKVLVRATKT